MKFYFSFYLLIICISLKSQYNKDNQTVKIKPFWEIGDTINYSETEREYTIKKNDTIFSKNKTFLFNINIIDKTEDGYILKWTMEPDYEQMPASIKNDFKEKLGPQIFIYKTNLDGQFTELINFDDIVLYNKKMVNFLGDFIKTEEEKINFEKAFDKVFGNDKVTLQLITSKINTYHLFYGNTLKLGKIEKEKIENINPVTNTKQEYSRSYELEKFSPEENTYSLYSETVPKQKNIKNELKSTLETIISQEVKDMQNINNINLISKVFQLTHNSGFIIYQLKKDFITVDEQQIIKELEFNLL